MSDDLVRVERAMSRHGHRSLFDESVSFRKEKSDPKPAPSALEKLADEQDSQRIVPLPGQQDLFERIDRAIYSKKGFDPNEPRDKQGRWTDGLPTTAIYEVAGDEGMVAKVFHHRKGYIVRLHDSEADETASFGYIFPDLKRAKERAETVRMMRSADRVPDLEVDDLPDPEKVKHSGPKSKDYKSVHNKFRWALVSNDVPQKQKAGYLDAVDSVMDRMPKGAIAAMAKNFEWVQFYPDTKSVTDSIPEYPGFNVAAYWFGSLDDGKGSLHLDGAVAESDSTAKMSLGHIYSHEFGHSCDWEEKYKMRISDTPDWKSAYYDELSQGELNFQSTIASCEGFAEFARLAWYTDYTPTEIQKSFPKCYAIFKKHGFIE